MVLINTNTIGVRYLMWMTGIIFLICLNFNRGQASAPNPSCEKTISLESSRSDIFFSLESRKKRRDQFDRQVLTDLRTVYLDGHWMNYLHESNSVLNQGIPKLGKYGGYVYTAKKSVDRYWWELFSPLHFGDFRINPQGDPRSAVMILGYDLAAILGVEVWDQDTLFLSDIKELNGRIDAFNVYLLSQKIDPLQIHFYSSPSDNDKSAMNRLEFYLFALKEESLLPHASPLESWPHFLHDVSFHRTFAVIAPEIAARIKTVIAHEYAFWLFAKKYFDQTLPFNEAKLAKRALIFELARDLDFKSAEIISSLVYALFDPNETKESDKKIKMGNFPLSAIDSLQKFEFTFEESRYYDFLANYFDLRRVIALNGNKVPEDNFVLLSSSSPKNIIRSIVSGIGRSPALYQYWFGADWEVNKDLINRWSHHPNIWLKAVDEYNKTQYQTGFSTPLIQGHKDFSRLAKKMAKRRKILMRAAKKFLLE